MRNDTEKSTDALWKKNERGNKGCPLFGKCEAVKYSVSMGMKPSR